MRQKQNPPRARTRKELAAQLKKSGDRIGSSLISAIDTELDSLSKRVDRAFVATRPRGSGSIIGSVVQVPRSDPACERAFDYLNEVKQTLERLNEEPF